MAESVNGGFPKIPSTPSTDKELSSNCRTRYYFRPTSNNFIWKRKSKQARFWVEENVYEV